MVNRYFIWSSLSGNRRPRNRSRGQLLVKDSKATALQFESDFDFETANAQFKDDLTKAVVGRPVSKCMLSFDRRERLGLYLKEPKLRNPQTQCIVCCS